MNNPALQAAQQRVAEARGDLTAASVLVPDNPELEIGAGPRLLDAGVSGNTVALEAALSQRLEIGGQRRHRIERANAEISAAEAEAASLRRTLDVAVFSGFVEALGMAERGEIAAEHESLARDLVQIQGARFERGAATPLDLNAARIRLAEATRQRSRFTAEARVAAARLAVLLGLDPTTALRLAGPLPPIPTSAPVLPASIVSERPDVLAAVARTRSAQASIEVARASAWPDLRLGVRYATEEGSRAVLGQVAVGVPLFQRKQGEQERASATATRAEAEERATRTQATAEIETARVEVERTRSALVLYDREVLAALRENLELLRRMLAAGKVPPSDVIVLQRELLEGRLGYVDARLDALIADARLRAAAGLPIVATNGDRS